MTKKDMITELVNVYVIGHRNYDDVKRNELLNRWVKKLSKYNKYVIEQIYDNYVNVNSLASNVADKERLY